MTNQNNNQNNVNIQEEVVYVTFNGMVMRYEEYIELIKSMRE